MNTTLAAALLAGLIATGAAAQPATPFRSEVRGPMLMIYPGEQVTVDIADKSNLKIVEVRAAEATNVAWTARRPPNTVTFNFAQLTDQGALLVTAHGLSSPVRYHANLMMPRPDGTSAGFSTSICPVPPKMSTYEAWPNKPVSILIMGVAPTTAADGACVD